VGVGVRGVGYIVDFQPVIVGVYYFTNTLINLQNLVKIGIFWHILYFVVFQYIIYVVFVILLFFSLLYLSVCQSIRLFQNFLYLCVTFNWKSGHWFVGYMVAAVADTLNGCNWYLISFNVKSVKRHNASEIKRCKVVSNIKTLILHGIRAHKRLQKPIK
jgi:hypothetical protein